MIDPRAAWRRTFARWLQVRAKVQALESGLAAAEHDLRRMARSAADAPEMAALVARLRAERNSVVALKAELDERVAALKDTCAAIDRGFVANLIARTRKSLGRR